MGVDFIGLSFVQRPEDLLLARSLINGRAAVISKIEKPAALEHLDEIILKVKIVKEEKLEIFRNYLAVRRYTKKFLKKEYSKLDKITSSMFSVAIGSAFDSEKFKFLSAQRNRVIGHIKLLEEFMKRDSNPIVVFVELSKTR